MACRVCLQYGYNASLNKDLIQPDIFDSDYILQKMLSDSFFSDTEASM